MKRHLSLLASALLVIVMVFAFASCDVIEQYIPEIPGLTHQHDFVDGKCECGEVDPDYVAPHEHNFVDGKCECGEVDPSYSCVDHVWSEPVLEKDATCTEEGRHIITCTKCGYVRYTPILPYEHEEETIFGYAATCTATGLTDGKKCTVCGKITVEQEEIPASHTEEEIPGVAPTCTETGLSAGVKCSVCDEILTAQVEIPATGHNYVDGKCECGLYSSDYVGDKIFVLDSGVLANKGKVDEDGLDSIVYADVNEFFAIHLAKKTKIEDNSKTFEDGFEGTKRLNWQTKSVIDGENSVAVIRFTVDGPAVIKVWWVSGGDGRTVAIYNEDGSILVQGATDSVKNSLYITELVIEKAGTYYLGNVDGSNNYYKVEATVSAAPAAPTSGVIDVVTKNSYGYNVMAEPAVLDSFTAPVTGFYTFNLPAGLGLFSKAQWDAYGNPEVEFYDNSMGESITLELTEGQVYEFYVGAETEQAWTITWTYSAEKPAEPTEITLRDGDNAFTVQEIDLQNGVTGYFYAYETALYTFKGEGLYINIYNGYGMLVNRGFGEVTVSLEGAGWGTEYTVVLGANEVGDYSVNISYVAPTELYEGENTVSVDGSQDCIFNAEYNGPHFFNVNGATVVVSGVQANADGSYTLESYTSYNITVTAETAGDYVVNVVAPLYLSQYEDNTLTLEGTTVGYFQTTDRGHYTIAGEGVTVVVTDAEGKVYEAGALLPGYTTYTVTLTVAEAGEYTVSVKFVAPVGSMDNPEAIQSLPATLTPDLSSSYSNYYYVFTATANGHVTVSFTANGAIGSLAVGETYAEEGDTTLTVPVLAGQSYKVYFSCGDPVEVTATLSFEAGEITASEWLDIVGPQYLSFDNNTTLTLSQDWQTGEYYAMHYQYDADWNVIFRAYYDYAITVNDDGTLTITLTYDAENAENVGDPAPLGTLVAKFENEDWVVSCVHAGAGDATCTEGEHCKYCGAVCGEPVAHTYVDAVCSVCGDLHLEATFNSAMPAGLTYITNNSSYPNPSFYSNGGIKFNYVNQGLQTVNFAAQTSVTVTLDVRALNSNTKSENADVDAFTFYALDANGEVVATATLNELVTGANTVSLSGEGIVAVKVVMTDYYSDGSKCYNVSIGGLIVD